MDKELSTRIRGLRIAHGYKSQQALADALNVDRSVVKSWERNSKPVLPRLDNLFSMCELFHCDLDYLTGRIEESTHDIHFVHEYTRLSEAAIKKLVGYDSGWRCFPGTLSKLIESNGFNDFMVSFSVLLDLLAKLKDSPINELEATGGGREEDGKIVLTIKDAAHFYTQRVSLAAAKICEDEIACELKKAMKQKQY